MEPAKQPDWKVSDLYSKAWQIIKNNKVLWIFGAALSGVATSSQYRSSSTSTSSSHSYPLPSPSTNPSVLGTSTSDFFMQLNHIFSSVPLWAYLTLALMICLAIIIGLIIFFVYQSWAEGALLSGINKAINNQPVSIKESSESSFKILKPLIRLRLIIAIPSLTLVVGIIAIVIYTLRTFVFQFYLHKSVANFPHLFLTIFTVSIIIFIFFIFMGIFNLLNIWATRKIVDGEKSIKQALRYGWLITKKKFWSIIGLGLVNIILGVIVSVILALPLIAIGISSFGFTLTNASPLVVLPIFSVLFLLSFVTIIASIFVRGIFTAFLASVWSVAYHNIKGKYESTK